MMKLLVAVLVLVCVGLSAATEDKESASPSVVEEHKLPASKYGSGGVYDPKGFSGAVLLITFIVFLATLVLLVLSGGSFLTITTTGRKRRDLTDYGLPEWTPKVLEMIQKGFEVWNKS